MELSTRIAGRQDRVATSLMELPSAGFTVWDLRAYWQPRDRLLLVAGIENFTNLDYREHLDHRYGHSGGGRNPAGLAGPDFRHGLGHGFS